MPRSSADGNKAGIPPDTLRRVACLRKKKSDCTGGNLTRTAIFPDKSLPHLWNQGDRPQCSDSHKEPSS